VAVTPSGGSGLALIAATFASIASASAPVKRTTRAYMIRSFRWVYRPYPGRDPCCGVLLHSALLRPERVAASDDQNCERAVLLLDETTEKERLRVLLFRRPGDLACVFRSAIGSSYAAWARRAAPIGWRLTRTAVQTACKVDFRAPR
jgi:hypothetical protein